MKSKLQIFLLLCLSLSLFAQESADTKTINYDIVAEYQKAIDYLAAFQYQKALDHIYECQRSDPGNLDYLSKLAWCYQQLGNYSESKLYYKKLLQEDSNNISALSNLGYIFEKELNYQQAKSYYRELLSIDTTNSYYYRINAYNAMKTKEPLVSIAYFNKAHVLNSKDLVVIDELANLYFQMEAFDYAISFTEKGLALAPDNFRLLYTDARVRNKVDSFRLVVNTLEHALSLGDTVPYYQTMLGVSYIHLDSLDKAAFHLHQIVNKKKASEHTHHYLSVIYDKKKEPEQSKHHLEQAIKKAISPKASLYYSELAAIHEKQKNHKKAIKLYDEAFEHSGKDVYLFHKARNTDFFYKDKKMALRIYKKYLATGHEKYREYSERRISELKALIHQGGG